MDITFYNASTSTSSKCSIVQVSDELYIKLAKSEFSQIGAMKDISLNLDGDMIEVKIVELSNVIRQAQILYFNELLPSLLQDSLEKMGDSPSSSEYEIYTSDLKTILELLENFKDLSFSYFSK
ncbi:hypothetical protein [Aliivibrio wodanis]|uniref:hypothetical protein n=1 Tax=Aliivibrio wodanis TaxID=80852 RepID=UPI00406BEEA7